MRDKSLDILLPNQMCMRVAENQEARAKTIPQISSDSKNSKEMFLKLAKNSCFLRFFKLAKTEVHVFRGF